MSCEELTVNPDNTSVVEVNGLKDSITGSFENAATVTVEDILDKDNVSVTGITFPVTLIYVASSNGIYRGNLPATAGFISGQLYNLTIKAVASGSTANWKNKLFAVDRCIDSSVCC